MSASWDERREAAEQAFVPWVETVRPLADATVLEYGCGNGPVSCAFGARAARHIGYDIDADAVAYGSGMAEQLGLDNVELHHEPVPGILDAVAAHAGEIDVFLFYAVLEHMTVDERLAALQTARDVVRTGGIIVICETPNRFIPWDWHSSQMPFFAQLPDDLALRYASRAPRADFVETIKRASATSEAAAREALVRFGRGMSFHELELVFGDLSQHVLASNWEPIVLDYREVHPEELTLARLMDQVRPDLAPAFSRYWLDVVLSVEPTAEAPAMLRPWPMHTLSSPDARWTGHESVHLPSREAALCIPLPAPTRRLVIGALSEADWLTIDLESGHIRLAETVQGHAGASRHASFRLPEAVETAQIRLDAPGTVTFVGYDA